MIADLSYLSTTSRQSHSARQGLSLECVDYTTFFSLFQLPSLGDCFFEEVLGDLVRSDELSVLL